MAHLIRDRQKLLNRIHRIRGQLDAIERAVDAGRDCSSTLQTIAACRGAINSLMVEVLEGHIRLHVIDPDQEQTSEQGTAAQELIDVIHSYLR